MVPSQLQFLGQPEVVELAVRSMKFSDEISSMTKSRTNIYCQINPVGVENDFYCCAARECVIPMSLEAVEAVLLPPLGQIPARRSRGVPPRSALSRRQRACSSAR